MRCLFYEFFGANWPRDIESVLHSGETIGVIWCGSLLSCLCVSRKPYVTRSLIPISFPEGSRGRCSCGLGMISCQIKPALKDIAITIWCWMCHIQQASVICTCLTGNNRKRSIYPNTVRQLSNVSFYSPRIWIHLLLGTYDLFISTLAYLCDKANT